jgi:hypothetical protein
MSKHSTGKAVIVALLCMLLAQSQLPVSAARVASEDWVTTQQWSGIGPMMTDPFDVTGSQWRIAISSLLGPGNPSDATGVIAATVLSQTSAGSTQQDTIQTTAGSTYSEDVSSGPGQYHLQITSLASDVNWTIEVQELR